MSIRRKNLALTTLSILSVASLAVGCTRDEPPQEKQQPAAVVEATAAPTLVVEATAAPALAPTEPATVTDPYEDSLVLLAEGEPDSGPAPLTVEFEVESLVVDEIAGARYTWDFGDGSPKSNEAKPTHTYERPGDYTATVGVVDANGEQGWDEVDILVEDLEQE